MGCTSSTHVQAGWSLRPHALVVVQSAAATPLPDDGAYGARAVQVLASHGRQRPTSRTSSAPPPPCGTSPHVHNHDVVLHFPCSTRADDGNSHATPPHPPQLHADACSIPRPPTCEWADVLPVDVSWRTGGSEARHSSGRNQTTTDEPDDGCRGNAEMQHDRSTYVVGGVASTRRDRVRVAMTAHTARGQQHR